VTDLEKNKRPQPSRLQPDGSDLHDRTAHNLP